MNTGRLIFFGLLFICTHIVGYAQQQPIQPQPLREADVMLSKRVWRVVDLRQKKNKVAEWPVNPVVKVMYDAVVSGQLRPYKDDSLRQFYHLEEFISIGVDTVYAKKLLNPNEDDGLYTVDTIIERLNPAERLRFLLIMEDVIFDKKSGTEHSRIIAIAPLYEKQVSGISLGLIPLCWLRYNLPKTNELTLRNVMVNSLMYNQGNVYQKKTYEQWFEQRLFESYIIKVSNPYDVFLMDDAEVKRNGLMALLKASMIARENAELEQDQYDH